MKMVQSKAISALQILNILGNHRSNSTLRNWSRLRPFSAFRIVNEANWDCSNACGYKV